MKQLKTLPDASSTGPTSDRCCALFVNPSAILPLSFQHELDPQFHSGVEGCPDFFRIHSDGESVDLICFLNGQKFQSSPKPKCFGDGNSEILFFQVCNMPKFLAPNLGESRKTRCSPCVPFSFCGKVNAHPPLLSRNTGEKTPQN